MSDVSSRNVTPGGRGLGYIRDLPDRRDMFFSADEKTLRNLPKKVDLRGSFPACYDQGALGSCTGNAYAGIMEYLQRKEGYKEFMPSRLMIYFDERYLENTVSSDSGATMRDGAKAVNKWGVCSEDLWPYDISRFADQPTADCYTEGKQNRALIYRRVLQNLNQMKGCLASGFPYSIGISVYESFESQQVANTGVVPMPGPNEQLLGGHALVVVGYDDDSQQFIVRNSWGESFGDSGYVYLYYQYLLDTNLSGDFWKITLSSGEAA